jgi:hypothetical protein
MGGEGRGWDMPVGFSVGVRAQQPDLFFNLLSFCVLIDGTFTFFLSERAN